MEALLLTSGVGDEGGVLFKRKSIKQKRTQICLERDIKKTIENFPLISESEGRNQIKREVEKTRDELTVSP